jgi:antitoxin component YwqK of YwqJK toxin-antitoxin module
MVNHGPFRRWYPNTVVAEEGFYLEGRKHGPYVLRHEAGNDHSRATYVEGQLDGWLREWDADGQPILEEEYRAGLRHGPHRSWDYLNGDYEEGAYEDDKATGPWEIVTSGTRSEGEFRDGRRRGLWRTWYPEKEGEEPRLQFEEHWVKGRLHGPTTEYGPKGNRLAEYHYAKGSAEGLQTQWYPGGGKKAEWTAKGGEPEGPMQYWFPDGRPQMVGEMRAGKREGRWTFYDIDGSVDEARSGVYEDGVRVSD